MSLATLVEYAQTSFGVTSPSTTEETLDTEAHGGSDPGNQSVGLPPVRPSVPDWIRTRRPEHEAPFANPDHKWRIHESIPLPAPDVDQLGADALAFYVPFHFYGKDWGIYIRDTGVKSLASVLKCGALIPGDEGY